MNPLPATVEMTPCEIGALTLSFTGTVCGAFPLPLGVMVMVPL